MADNCVNRILNNPDLVKELFGDNVPRKEVLDRIEKDLRELYDVSQANPDLGNFDVQSRKYLQELIEVSEADIARRAADIKKVGNLIKHLDQEGFAGDAVGGLLSTVTSVDQLANGGRLNAESLGNTYMNQYLHSTFGRIEEKGLTNHFLSGEFDLEIRRGVQALERGRPKPDNITEESFQIAQIIDDFNRMQIADAKRIGMDIRDARGNFVETRNWSREQVQKTPFEEWKEDILNNPYLDKEKTFGKSLGKKEEMDEVLRNFYDSIVNGKQGTRAPITPEGIIDSTLNEHMTRNDAKRMSESRGIFFTDVEGYHQLAKKYSDGNMSANMVRSIIQKSKMQGMVEVFGSNPMDNLIKVKQRRIDILKNRASEKRSVGDYDAAKKLDAQARKLDKSKRPENALVEYMGTNNNAGVNTSAQISSAIRTINQLSLLGKSGIRAFPNLGFTGIELKNSVGDTYVKAQARSISEWGKTIPPGQKNRIANSAKIYTDSLIHEITRITEGQLPGNGMMAKGVRFMFKYNAMDMMTQGNKIGIARAFMNYSASYRNDAWEQINPQFKATLLGHRLDKEDWDVLRQAVEKLDDGNEYITPEAISKLPEGSVGRAAQRKKMSPENYKRQLELRYNSILVEKGQIAATEATIRERSFINRGTSSGTFDGELLRFIGQFKTFLLQSFNISLRNMNAKPDVKKLNDGILMTRGINDGTLASRLWQKDKGNMAAMVLGLGTFGMISEQIVKHVFNDEYIGDIDEVDTWRNALLKSGAGGIYTDFLLGEYGKFNAAESLLGPTIGTFFGDGISDFSKFRDDFIKGDEDAASKYLERISKTVQSRVPFRQVPGMKQAIDYMQNELILEQLNPEKAAERRIEEQRKELGEE